MDISLWTATLEESFEYSFKLFMAFLPKSLGALMLLGLGILFGKIVEAGTGRVLNMIGVDRLLSGTGVMALLQKIGSKKTISQIIGLLGFWLVFLLFLISATEALSLALLSETLTALIHYLPKIGLATLILVLGLLAANFVRDLISVACDSSGIRQGTIIAQTIYMAGTLLVLVTAINELGIDTSLLNQIIVILIAGLIAGAALSFGIGSRSAVKILLPLTTFNPLSE